MSAEIAFCKDQIDSYLKEVAKQYRKLNRKGMPAEITLIGGASILVNYGFRDSTYDVDALIQVKKHLLRLLSGSIIPLWFFPDWFANILKALPFAYIYQLPLDIYIGKSSDAEVLQMMTIQAIWLAVLLLAFFIVSRRATRKVMIQGG